MAATSNPYGLQVIGRMGPNQAFSAYEETDPVVMTTNSAVAVGRGDLLCLTSAGQPTAGNATPTTTIAAATSPVGIVTGISFKTPTGEYVHKGIFLPAGAVTAGYTDIKIYYTSDPDVKFRIQASGAVTVATGLGKNAALTNFTNATALVGSKVQLDQSTLAATGTLAVKIIGFHQDGSNAIGDAYTDCICVFNHGVHRMRAAAGI